MDTLTVIEGLNALTKEEVQVPIEFRGTTGSQDPTSTTPKMAFIAQTLPPTAPVLADWQTATWFTQTIGGQTTYFINCMIGPGGVITLTAGTTYDVWIQVTDGSNSIVVRRVAVLPVLDTQ